MRKKIFLVSLFRPQELEWVMDAVPPVPNWIFTSSPFRLPLRQPPLPTLFCRGHLHRAGSLAFPHTSPPCLPCASESWWSRKTQVRCHLQKHFSHPPAWKGDLPSLFSVIFIVLIKAVLPSFRRIFSVPYPTRAGFKSKSSLCPISTNIDQCLHIAHSQLFPRNEWINMWKLAIVLHILTRL